MLINPINIIKVNFRPDEVHIIFISCIPTKPIIHGPSTCSSIELFAFLFIKFQLVFVQNVQFDRKKILCFMQNMYTFLFGYPQNAYAK